jgi:hypothetical protein
MTVSKPTLWSRISLPLKVGLAFALVAMLLAAVGIVRGIVPADPRSILLALLISGGSWGLVSWAVATAVVDVERDVAEQAAEEAPRATESERETEDDEG